MITTIVDKKYLYKEARYLLSSIYKYMPNEKFYLFLVNCNKEVKKDILLWNPNTIIDFRDIEIPEEQYAGYMYVMMNFSFYWILNEVEIEEDIIYLDADIVLKGDISELYNLSKKYDLMFRYHPFNRIQGPSSIEYGGILNSGCTVISNNDTMKEYTVKLKDNIQNYLDTKKDPVIYVEEANVITCIDQEMIFTTYLEMKNKINFFPLNNIYNDTQYTQEGIVWHAKGIHRTYPEYLIECYKYGKEDVNILKEYIRLYYSKFKKFVKSFLVIPKESLHIKELEDIFKSINLKSITLINSDFYLENESLLKNKDIKCYDTDPVIYYKNKATFKNKNIIHEYILYDTQVVEFETNTLLIYEEHNLSIKNILSKHILVKTDSNLINRQEYRISDKYKLTSPDLDEIINLLHDNSHKYTKFLHPKWNNYIVDKEVELFINYLQTINKDIKILEIGSGDGYCSYKFSLNGFKNIVASDIEPRFPAYFNVHKVSAEKLPYNDNEFDLIISMNVLEHIEDIDTALSEMSRVLKQDGLMLHSMPTPYLNMSTILLMPMNYFRNIFYLLNGYWLNKYQPLKGKNILRFIKFIFTTLNPIKIFFYKGHGIHGMFSSLYKWSYKSWYKRFAVNKLDVIEIKNLEVFLTLLKLFPFKFESLRNLIGSHLPPVYLYIIKKGKNDTKRS